jgi:hypothetical protein
MQSGKRKEKEKELDKKSVNAKAPYRRRSA